MNHTPTPWEFDDVWALIKGPEGEEVAAIHAGHSERKQAERFTGLANAELIIQAVNSYQAMKEALESTLVSTVNGNAIPVLVREAMVQALILANGKDNES